MTKWTAEQLLAIEKDNTNIIVSAGAGSGKTAVLTERVIRKLKSGISIDRLLVLTFTDAASKEMKQRIRKKILEDESLKDELNKIDNAYISTFDSLALFIVKKYHYLLNITPDVKICNSSILKVNVGKILDEVFEYFYGQQNEDFVKLINDFCLKNDNDLKKMILNISNNLDMRYDKKEYLDHYLENNFNDDKILQNINLYLELIKNKILAINNVTKELSSYVDGDYYNELLVKLKGLFEAHSYEDIYNNVQIELNRLPSGSSLEAKELKATIVSYIKEVQQLCEDNLETIKQNVWNSYDYVKAIVNILIRFDEKVSDFKAKNNLFEFVDISKLAIKVVKENQEIRDELTNYYNEILLDEYQDTSDLQEMFVSLISNNNVYMVGDVKQSIYRFRNANPDIFRDKYNLYSDLKAGYKIDLNKNFRSRQEVVNNINNIFSKIMDNLIGGADYQESHQMVFGNNDYMLNQVATQNNDMEIIDYAKSEGYFKEEIEAFIIARDIYAKVNNRYQVYDKNAMRDAKYSDFAILMSDSKNFNLYKKIFEYVKVPLIIDRDDNINNSFDLMIIYNIINLICKTKYKQYDDSFKYSLVCISRSFLFNLPDQEIFEEIVNNNYVNNSIIKIIEEIIINFDSLDINTLFDLIISKFDYYNKLITIGNVNDSIRRIDYLSDLFMDMSNMGYNIQTCLDYLKVIVDSNFELRQNNSVTGDDSVKIMTIHKSKGREYSICYLASLFTNFNTSDLNSKLIYDNDFGIIAPYFNDGLRDTIYKVLLKNKYKINEVSEKIRLFYVAMTRGKEKLILINSFEGSNCKSRVGKIVNNDLRLSYNSFSAILNSIYEDIMPYVKKIDLKSLNLSKDYGIIKDDNYQNKIKSCQETLNNKNLNIVKELEIKQNFSKKDNELLDNKVINDMEFGNKVHKILEYIDFKNPYLNMIDDKFILTKVKAFLGSDLLKDLENTKIYHEYEFSYEVNNVLYHGIIDLIIEHDSYISIIDYKLNNIDDSNYIKQLDGYRNYITAMTHKEVNCYLYSIINETYVKI